MDLFRLGVDVIGWAGSAMLIIAYWLVSKGKISAQSFIYQFLNAFGSLLLVVNTFYYGAYPSSLVNIIWVFIGIFYIAKIQKKEESVNSP
ncbi:MAG: hypothetical protein AAF502_12605 [Bacteroidota bacterium]